MTNEELIEDYCMRASEAYPWAVKAGREIKNLKLENEQLRIAITKICREQAKLFEIQQKILRQFI